MLTLIITGKRQVKNMDIYLVLFIDEMKLLRKGIRMYDISCHPSNRSFSLYGVLCWTNHHSYELVFVSIRYFVYVFTLIVYCHPNFHT